MYTITLSIPKSSKHSAANEVNWESIDSHFRDLYADEFVCVVKPYNGDHTLAKVFFNKKIVHSNRSDDILINNSIPVKIVDRKEEPNAPVSVSNKVRLPCPLEEGQLVEIQIELEEQYKAQVTPDCTDPPIRSVILKACHQEVLISAEDALRKWLSQFVGAAASAPSTVPKTTVAGSSRRPLFPQALTAGASAGSSSQGVFIPVSGAASLERDIGPFDFEIKLSPECSLKVQPIDITSPEMHCDLMVVSTSCSLSLNFGLARVVAAKAGERALKHLCHQHITRTGVNLKFGETHLVKTPPNDQLPARYILFIALPNDKRLTERIDAGQFKVVMADVVAKLLTEIFRLSADPDVQARVVAMTALGSNLPYWADLSEDFAHVLAGGLWELRTRTGNLRCLNICDLQIESLATLGRVLEARFALSLKRQPQPRPRTNRTQQVEALDDDGDDGVCEICSDDFSARNPAVKFHCNRGRLCSTCAAILNDPEQAGNGKCPFCMERYRPATGLQPTNGNMTCSTEQGSLPGHEGYGTIVVAYTFGPGVQGPGHPSPGQPYRGLSRVAYFPDSPAGRAVVTRVKAAFQGRAVFTIGTSATTGMDNTLTWATVHHKTSTSGGTERHGYPDPTYLQRVSDELTDLGY